MKKMIAPIIIFIVIIAYFILLFMPVINDPFTQIGYKILIGSILLFLMGTFIYVFIERIREIKEGKEDDLSKY